jgi:hypothetical protein
MNERKARKGGARVSGNGPQVLGDDGVIRMNLRDVSGFQPSAGSDQPSAGSDQPSAGSDQPSAFEDGHSPDRGAGASPNPER